MPAPDLEWRAYQVPEEDEAPPSAIATTEAQRVTVWIPDLSAYPEAHDKAKILLETAAEVEHALLVQYLYAAFSLKKNTEVSDPVQKNALTTWSLRVRRIAFEEMAHLMSVQNLLLAIGLRPNLEREDFPPRKDLYPFKLRLQPLSQRSLAKYVTAEAPQDATGIADIVEQAKEERGTTINRVGTIYGLLGVVFSTAEQITGGGSGSESWDRLLRQVAAAAYLQDRDPTRWHLGDNVIDPRTLAFQADGDDWHGAIIHRIEDRAAARGAIRQIGEQGEGPTSSGEESHFERFRSMYQGGNGLPPFPSAGEWTPTRDVPQDPITAAIAEPRTQRWARLADLRYELLLGFIEHHLLTSDANDRGNLAGWAFEEMSALGKLSAKLVTLPLRNGVAALPFTLPALSQLHLPDTEPARWQLQRERTETAIGHIQLMQADPADMNNPDLTELLRIDTDRLPLMHRTPPVQTTSFDRDILPLFRPVDIEHMNDQVGLNLTDFDAVRGSAAAISDRLKGIGGRRMPPPPDPPMSDEQIRIFHTWIAEGCPP